MENINIVKIGSDSINDENLQKIINHAKMHEKQTGEKFLFISSGAVSLGKKRVLEVGKNIDNFSKSTLSSIGQKFLMKKYGNILGEDELIGEILIDDYANDEHLSDTLENSVKNNVCVIINHNDTMHSGELSRITDKTDNDKNTIHITKVLKDTSLKVLRVIYLTNTNGLLDEKKDTVIGGKIIGEKDKDYYRGFVNKNKSNSGTGGMESKLNYGFEVLEHGVDEVIISNAKHGLECLNNSKNSTTLKRI